MGQEHSFVSHPQSSVASARRHSDNNYEDPVQYRSSPIVYSPTEIDPDFKRHKARRSADSFKSNNTESSGYRSGSSAYESRSNRSSSSDYYCTSLYKNDHYRDLSKELYKPVKIPKEKRYKLQIFNEQACLKRDRLQSYHSDTDKSNKSVPAKKAGIRNYKPKILSEDDQKRLDKWI